MAESVASYSRRASPVMSALREGRTYQGIFVSDLHLFSRRSVGQRRLDQLTSTFPKADLLVLGGDIFDFRWSALGAFDASLYAARRWLLELTEAWPGDLVFLPGNHDCIPEFLDEVEAIARDQKRFGWYPHQVQLGDALFLHGDLLDSGGGLARLAHYRRRFHHESPKSRMAHRAYDMAVALRVHRAIPKLRHQPILTCQKLLSWLPQLSDSPEAIRRVFFGHTHVPVAGLQIGSVRFHNPGAAIRHLSFAPVHFELSKCV
jgi:UDP-2,3-diacylglucosamine pyrophosphatase LpxH